MDDSVNTLFFFSGVAMSRDSNGFSMYLPRGCLIIYTHYQVRDTTIPPCAGENDLLITRPLALAT